MKDRFYTIIPLLIILITFVVGGERFIEKDVEVTLTKEGALNINQPESNLVVKVYDGDTATLANDERIRLIGINAPEIGKDYALESKLLLSELILNKEVTYEFDTSKRDKYGRLLVYVYIDDIFVNEYIVRKGLAYASSYDPDTAKQSILDAAENDARNEKIGVWSE